MGKTIGRMRAFFILIFVLAAGWFWFDQIVNVEPRKDCEEKGGWWSPELRVCKTPLSIRAKETPQLTELKRKLAETRAREKAEAQQAPARK